MAEQASPVVAGGAPMDTADPAVSAPVQAAVVNKPDSNPQDDVLRKSDLAAYIADLKASLAPAPAQSNPAPVYQAKPASDKPLHDLIFEDPEAAIAKIKQEAKAEVKAEIDSRELKKARDEQFWKEFYSEHPDLKNHERAVKLVLKDKFEELKGLSLPEAKKALSLEAKGFIDSVRGPGRKEELPSGAAESLGSQSRQQVSPQETPAVEDFVTQIAKWRSKRMA